jgi:hypothetical protein
MIASRPGKVLTFYSYKGGVGRSMALANVAVLLASNGHKILIVDWDLEAPGIEHYFRGYLVEPKDKERKEPRPGVVDLMQARAKDSEIDWRKGVATAALRGSEIHILGAGQRSPTYANALAALSWKDLFNNHDLGRYLEQLRGEWTAAYDFVLVDSRTGITDIGGICTIHLPDVVVALFTSNEQSLTGVVQVMRDARREQAALPVDRSRLLILPLPSRDESQSEHQRSEEWYVRFARELDEFYREWLPARLTAAEALDILRIPYKAYWSFGEPLPVIEEGISRPTSLGYAYAMVASLIESGFDWSQMTAGRYATDRSIKTIDVPAPTKRSLSVWSVVVLAGILVIVFGAVTVGLVSKSAPKPDPIGDPNESIYGDPRDGADAGPQPRPAPRTAAAFLAAAGRTEVALQRVLLLREIPEPVFPAAEVKELLKGMVVPEAVLRSDASDGYVDARFDRRGERVVLTRRSGAVVVAAGGRGPQITLDAAPPLGLAAFSADDGHVITADAKGVTIWDARTGDETARVQYFAEHPARFTAIAEGNDGQRNFLLAGPGGSVGTRNAVFAIEAASGTVEQWWNARQPLRAIDFHSGRLWYVTNDGGVYSMSRPKQIEGFLPPLAVDAAVIARGQVALARGDSVVARPLDRKVADSVEIKIATPTSAPVQSNPPYSSGFSGSGFAAIAIGDRYLAAAVRSSVEIAPLTSRALNESVRLAAGDAALVAPGRQQLSRRAAQRATLAAAAHRVQPRRETRARRVARRNRAHLAGARRRRRRRCRPAGRAAAPARCDLGVPVGRGTAAALASGARRAGAPRDRCVPGRGGGARTGGAGSSAAGVAGTRCAAGCPVTGRAGTECTGTERTATEYAPAGCVATWWRGDEEAPIPAQRQAASSRPRCCAYRPPASAPMKMPTSASRMITPAAAPATKPTTGSASAMRISHRTAATTAAGSTAAARARFQSPAL